MEVIAMTSVDDIETCQCPSPSLDIPLGEEVTICFLHPYTISHTLCHSHLFTDHMYTSSPPHSCRHSNQSVGTCLYMPRDVCSAIWLHALYSVHLPAVLHCAVIHVSHMTIMYMYYDNEPSKSHDPFLSHDHTHTNTYKCIPLPPPPSPPPSLSPSLPPSPPPPTNASHA